MSVTSNKIAAPLILLSFIAMAFFGFSSMAYGSDGQMQGTCPFSAAGASLCPPSALPGTIHHLSGLQSTLNVPVSFAMAALLISLLVAALILTHILRPPLLRPLAPVRIPHHYLSVSVRTRKITRRLSLFENSPPRR